MKVYLDNAATTPIDKKVIEVMLPVLENKFGNPSSVHSFGRETRAMIDEARNKVASYINATSTEIFFTSGGTEADNMVIRQSVDTLNVTHIITTTIEHHAVIDTAIKMQEDKKIKLSLVNIDEKGYVDLNHLEELLAENQDKKTLVSLMHANNEIGNLLPLKKTSLICKKYQAYFHSDTVQTMAHYKFDVQELGIDFLTCSAHKFHGPKGIGFLFVNQDININSMITGGSQERNMRAGTENIYGIIALSKAMEIAHDNMEGHQKHILGIKEYMMEQLEEVFKGKGLSFNGDPKGESLYTVLNVLFPESKMNEMFLYCLDIDGVAASGGSACSSGSAKGSHVLQAIGTDMTRPSIRFSFSKYNTKEEIDYTIKVIKKFYQLT